MPIGRMHLSHRITVCQAASLDMLSKAFSLSRPQDNQFIYVTCFIIINRLVLWDPPVNYYSGDKDQFSIQGIQLTATSVSSYEKFSYHHRFQGTSENWTVLCCIRHGLTSFLPPAPPIRTLWHMALPTNVLTLTLTLIQHPADSRRRPWARVVVRRRGC